jgi:hypothetical protein
MCRANSRLILLRVWLEIFWMISMILMAVYLLHASWRADAEEVVELQRWQVLVFVAAGLVSMVYVRWWFYPRLLAKKNDEGAQQAPTTTAHAVVLADSPPLAISIV